LRYLIRLGKKWRRKEMLKRYLKDQRGLTLIELLAVIVILGIIAAIAIPSIGGIIDNTKTKAHKANALMILDAARMYYIDNPSDATVDTTTLKNKGYLDAVPVDPKTNALYSPATVTKDATNGQLEITLGTYYPADGHWTRAKLTGDTTT
jgi:type IV pilus assembly protein PilA